MQFIVIIIDIVVFSPTYSLILQDYFGMLFFPFLFFFSVHYFSFCFSL